MDKWDHLLYSIVLYSQFLFLYSVIPHVNRTLLLKGNILYCACFLPSIWELNHVYICWGHTLKAFY